MKLRRTIVRSGRFLAIRQGVGMVVGLVGIVLLTRQIGPGAYGLFAGAVGIFSVTEGLLQFGLGQFLVRSTSDDLEREMHQVFTLWAIVVGAGVIALMASLPLLDGWMDAEGFVPVAAAIFASLPLVVFGRVPLAKLEKEFRYEVISGAEISGQIAYYATALPLAYGGAGAWAPVAGWWVERVLLIVWYTVGSRYVPRVVWRRELIRDMLGYGLTYSAGSAIGRIRGLANPLLVGHFLGKEAMGHVAFAVRMIQVVSFMRVVTSRLAFASFASVQHSKAEMLKGLREGMEATAFAVGVPLALSAVAMPYVVPLVFGDRWEPVAHLYPLLAAVALFGSIFALPGALLHVLRKNASVAAVELMEMLALGIVGCVAIPAYGIIGYGFAELAMVVPMFAYLVFARRSAGGYPTWETWWIAAAAVAPLFMRELGPWGALLLLVSAGVFLRPAFLRKVAVWKADIMGQRFGGGEGAEDPLA